MKRPLTALLIAAVGTVALAQEVTRAVIADKEVSLFIDDWFSGMRPSFRAMAYKHKPAIVHWTLEYDLDPLLVVATMAAESSFRDWVVGKRGEIGLMQLNNDPILAKYPKARTVPSENIHAGCELLRDCQNKCQSLKAVMGCYMLGGRCVDHGSWLDHRWEIYQKAVDKFRKARTE